MKILHVIATLARRDGGPSKACLEMARAVARRGHEVTVFTTNKDGAGTLDVPIDQPVIRDGVTVRYFPIAAPGFWGRSPAMAAALKVAIPEMDIVHMHSLYLYHNMIVGRTCRRAGVPYILRPHGTLDPRLWHRHRLRKLLIEVAFQNQVTRGAARIHYTTEDERVNASPYTFGVPEVAIPNGLDMEDYMPLPPAGTFRNLHPEIGDRPMVLFYGRLNFIKGLDVLCDAFAEVTRERPAARLVFAGPDWGMESAVRQWLAERGLTEKVLFTGMLSGREGLAALRDADLFVLPSYSENFGIAVIEALACGTPVAISEHVKLCHDVARAGAGWVTPAAAGPFSCAIIEALADPDEAKRRGECGRALVVEQFSWPRIAVELERLYDEIVSGVVSAAPGSSANADGTPEHESASGLMGGC